MSGRYGKCSQFDNALDYRSTMPQFTEKGMEQNSELLSLLYRLAKEKNAVPSQISLAWMMCKKPYIVPIPGTRKMDRLKENAAAADIVLTNDEIAEIDRALSKLRPIAFEPVKNGYHVLGERVGNAFKDGGALK